MLYCDKRRESDSSEAFRIATFAQLRQETRSKKSTAVTREIISLRAEQMDSSRIARHRLYTLGMYDGENSGRGGRDRGANIQAKLGGREPQRAVA